MHEKTKMHFSILIDGWSKKYKYRATDKQGHNLSMVELSNELLQKGYASVEDLMRFGLIENKTSVVVFIHKTIEMGMLRSNLLYVPIIVFFFSWAPANIHCNVKSSAHLII